MAGLSGVLEDNTLLSQVDRALFRVEGWLALLSGMAVFSLMILAVISVSGRGFFNQPLHGYVDWIEQAMPIIAFMGVAFAQRLGGHIRMDIFVGALKGRTLWLVEFITTLAILVLMILLVWGTWSHFLRSFDFASPLWSRDSSMDIAIPLWPAKLLPPIAFSVLCLRLLIQLWGYGRAFLFGLVEPVAVPLVQSAAEQAAAEAETVSGSEDL